jgi:membrane fusion protein, heavy metal efflux system
MKVSIFQFRASWVLSAMLVCGLTEAADSSIEMSDEEIARLGVELGMPRRVDGIAVASGPAEVVVPPDRQRLVSSPLAGLVVRVFVAEGDPVDAGQPVAEIESPDVLDWQREYLEARVESDLAATQRRRDEGLYEDGIIAARRVEETSARARAAEIRLSRAEQRLRIAGFSQAELEVLARRGELSRQLTLQSPLTGFVLEQYTRIGAQIDALSPVARVADVSTLWLELRLPQESAAQVTAGMRVEGRAGAVDVWGTVTTVGQFVDAATQTVLVRAVFDNTDATLRAGQFASARVIAIDEAALEIPTAAVTRHQTETLVFVRSPQGFETRAVEVVSSDGGSVYVRGTIDGDTRIAVTGISALKSLWLAGQEG